MHFVTYICHQLIQFEYITTKISYNTQGEISLDVIKNVTICEYRCSPYGIIFTTRQIGLFLGQTLKGFPVSFVNI